ncbi:MAG: N(5)-(carboxyethyl)ornithine synthase [Candidatus Nealsonbacteria bacterium]|nr:N(5)-(carboxyethyl)ornithine synthase [Candidatus Nealsonbacteria bacterium]
MTAIGFPIPQKRNEQRRALLPPDLENISGSHELVFETGYGDILGYDDDTYCECGAVVAERSAVCACPVICVPKPVVTDEYFQPNKTVFGWIHAVQGRKITDLIVQNKMTVIAWEDMFENGRHTFWRNNELSGEAAIVHAFLAWGRAPYGRKVAVIGRGNVARGAIRVLERSGCHVTVYDRKTSPILREEVGAFDVVVNAVLWDLSRTDHILYEEDLRKLNPGSLIIDISCDEGMGIQSSHATTVDSPVYWHRGVLHYAVDHTPTLYFRTASESISKALLRFIPHLVEEKPNQILEEATIVRQGEILDQRIIRFQSRQPLPESN